MQRKHGCKKDGMLGANTQKTVALWKKNMVVEWVACSGQTHKNGNTMQKNQEVDKKRGARKGRRERDKKETTWEVVVIVCLG